MLEEILRVRENRQFLQNTLLFGEMVSFPVQHRIARVMQKRISRAGESVRIRDSSMLALLFDGEVALFTGGVHFETIERGGFWGEVTILHKAPSLFDAITVKDSAYFIIPGEVLADIPIVQWKLTETFRRRLSWFRTYAHLEWSDECAVGIKEIDDRRQKLFKMVKAIKESFQTSATPEARNKLLDILIQSTRQLFDSEEAVMSAHPYPELEDHRKEHGKLIPQIEMFKHPGELLMQTGHESIGDFLKDWLLTHTILEDRKLKLFFMRR